MSAMRTNCVIRIAAAVVAACVVLNVVNSEIDRGTCGDNVNYVIDDDGTLRVFGIGEMVDYEGYSAPYRSYCRSVVKTVEIGNGVTKIGNNAFLGGISIQSVSIPESVVTIGVSSFSQCSGLLSVSFPENLTSIGHGAFESCTGLREVTFGNALRTIGDYAFAGCHGLTSVVIPDSVITIESQAFSSCWNLTHVTIGKSVTTIGGAAFDIDNNYSRVFIPDSVTSIGTNAFRTGSFIYAFFQGSKNISCSKGFHPFTYVCVPPDYEISQFCGLSLDSSSSTDLCKAFQKKFDHCFKGAYIDGEFIAQKRDNATEWESRTNKCKKYECDNNTGEKTEDLITCDTPPACYEGKGVCNESSEECEYNRKPGWEPDNHCYEVTCEEDEWVVRKRKNATEWKDGCRQYQCDNDTGAVSWSLCNRTADDDRICVDDKCIDKNTMKDKVPVVVDVADGVNVKEINTTSIVEIINLRCHVEMKDMIIGWEVDGAGFVSRIIVYVDDEQTANVIATSIEEMKKGEECQYGVLCRTKTVFVPGTTEAISGSPTLHDMMPIYLFVIRCGWIMLIQMMCL